MNKTVFDCSIIELKRIKNINKRNKGDTSWSQLDHHEKIGEVK